MCNPGFLKRAQEGWGEMDQQQRQDMYRKNSTFLHREADISASVLPQAVESLRENIPRLGCATDAAFMSPTGATHQLAANLR